MKEIQLTQGYVAIVDDEDYDRVAKHRWSSCVKRRKNGSIYAVYAHANVYKKDGTRTKIKIHRFILNAPDDKIVDHIDGDGLNNLRENIRICSHVENRHNVHVPWGRSAFKGVGPVADHGKWRARINVNGERIVLGLFTSELDAARAYDAAALKYFGEFARINTYE